MKIEVKEIKPFNPIAIILETQDEVDRFYSLGNHSTFAREMELKSLYELLVSYRDAKNANEYHTKLHNLLK